MRLNSIKLTNFRGFEHKEFSFDPHMTIVVGNNATGKSSLLRAVEVALGAYLSSLPSLLHDKDYRMNFSPKDIFMRYDESKEEFCANPERTKIDVEADLFETFKEGEDFYTVPKPVTWWRELRGRSTTHTEECAGYVIQFGESLENARRSKDPDTNAIFPIIRSFGTLRIDYDYQSEYKRKIRESRSEKAYKSALQGRVDFKRVFDWLCRYNSELAKGREFSGNSEALINALYTAVPGISNIEIDSKSKEFAAKVSLPHQSPVYQSFEHMSDSYKAILCMAADLAYRCVQLNGFLGEDTVKKTPGVVIIDDVELHLHPSWQKHILPDLMRAFPMIQFIVSSHSPFIIQSMSNQNIITLDGKKGNIDPFKRSIEEIATSEMDMDTLRSKRFKLMVETAEEYYQLIRQSKDDTEAAKNAKRRLDQIEEDFSDDPAYVALLKIERKGQDCT